MNKAGALSTPPAPAARWLGGPVRRFLRLIGEGERPDVVGFLDAEPGLEPAERVAVLRADQRLRWRAGERVPAEWYFERFPVLADVPDLALDLIYSEYLLREGLGDPQSLDDYLARFPQFAEPIKVQVAFHLALEPDESHEAYPSSSEPLIPGYEIHGELGVGGMGVVYDAFQIGLKRRVAIKMALGGLQSDEDHMRRFRFEAEAAASLHHPNIVEIYETGVVDGRPYFSMELVEGGPLTRALAAGPLPARKAARLAGDLALAMHYAHDRGIIHRDLKPANVLLTVDAVPKIADFGLAKHLGNDARRTQSGTVLGSPCYMSPEQASGGVRDTGPATDVYSLGAILYEMLTGVPPFYATSPLETLRKLLNEDPDPPSKLCPKVPRDLETICLKCLEKPVRKRYGSARELGEDLERFLNHESVRARPVAPPERVWRWCRRKTSLAVAMALAMSAIAATIVLSISFAVYQYHAANRIGEVLREAQGRRRQVDQMAARLAYDHGQALCEQGDIAQGSLWLVRGLRNAAQARDDALEHAFRLNLSGWWPGIYPLKARFEHPGSIEAAAYSPNGRLVATAGDDHTLRLHDAATGEPIGAPMVHPDRVMSLAFSPDGQSILTGCEDSQARLWKVATGARIGPGLRHQGSVLGVAFRHDGRAMITGSTDHTAWVWDVATGQPMGKPLVHQNNINGVAFSPDGRNILTASWDKTARLWDATTYEPIGEPLRHLDWVSSVAFSPDGRTLLTGSYDRTARLWDRLMLEPIGPPMRHQHCVAAVDFSPDGRQLVTGSYDGTVRFWTVDGGKGVGPLLRHQHTVSAVKFSPDGRTVLTSSFDRSARVWEVAATTGLSFRHEGFIRAVTFSPDGRTILSASEDHTARLWNAADGRPIGPPLRHEDSVEAIAFSPSGAVVLTGSLDGTARLWNAETGMPIGSPLTHTRPVRAVAFSPRSDRVLTGSDDKTARLWDAHTGWPAGPPLAHHGKVGAVAFSPDGSLALTGDDTSARLWRAYDGTPAGKPFPHDGRVLAVRFSPDGETILTGSDDMKARLWDARTGELRVSPLRHDGPVTVAAFSTDGKTAITGGWDRVARLWEVSSGMPMVAPLRHDGSLRALAVSRDDRTVLTGSYDRTAQLWDKATGNPIGPAFRHESQVWFVAFGPDDRTVLSGGQENTAYLWNVPGLLSQPFAKLERLIHVRTGMTLLEDGSLRILDLADWSTRRAREDRGEGKND